MTMIRKLIPAEINQLGDDEVEVILSTSAMARDGHVLVPEGCQLENYLANPIVLWSHDPDKPIGNAEDIVVSSDKITARIRFAPLGISHKADEIRGLMKAGVIRAVSVGFDPIDGSPLDARKPDAGQRFTEWELLEFSPVSVPSDTGAIVTARQHGGANGEPTMPDTTDTDGQTSAPTTSAPMTRDHLSRSRSVGVIGFTRGMYDVGNLCSLFSSLGWQVDSAKYEAAMEGDQSKVPSMLASVLHDLGDALLEMTREEIAEVLAKHCEDPEEDDSDTLLVVEQRQHIRSATNPAVRAFRRGFAQAQVRAGKTLSTASAKSLRAAKALHEEAMDLHRSAMRKHKDGVAAIDDMLERAGGSDTTSKDDTAKTTDTQEQSDDPGARAQSAFNRRQADLQSLTAS